MPIENERKFVLARNAAHAAFKGWTRHYLRQAYLEDGPRIREADGVRTFTYKRWIAATQELLEVETEFSHEDFEMLWSERATALSKTRYARALPSGDWVVDFMRDDAGAVYFALAEVELPRGVAAPSSIPDEVAAILVYAVDATDNRFANKRLTDVSYATALYSEVAAKT